MPQTVLVFRSVSRRSLRIIVLCKPKEGELPQTAEDYEQFLQEAQQQAAKYYKKALKIDPDDEAASRNLKII